MKKEIVRTTSCHMIALLSVALFVARSLPAASQSISLGRLQTGAAITFIRTVSDGWGIEINGGHTPRIAQRKPAAIKFYRADDDIRQLFAGYKTVLRTATGIDAKADVPAGEGVVFHVHDSLRNTGKLIIDSTVYNHKFCCA